MSETIRLTALAGSLFAMSYFGVAWVMAGTPAPDMSRHIERPMQILASLPAAALNYVTPNPLPPAIAPPSVPVVQPRPVPQAVLPPGDGNPQRDQLRRDALQASSAYALTPCDEAAKAVMVQAVSAYAQAWADMMGCGPDGCDYKKINATAATFSTPLDIRVRETVGASLDKRGVSIDDFPSTLRINVAMLVRGRGATATACPQTRAHVTR
jgi:hypothetical protein